MTRAKPYTDNEGEVRELDEQFFVDAKRGRPPMNPGEQKVRTTISLDPDVVAFFKQKGPGYQTRINAALRKAAGLESNSAKP